MERWLIQLAGNRTDTEELPLHFPSGAIYAVDDNGTVFLTGPGLDQLSDAEAVYEAGKAALNRFAGVLTLDWPHFQCPTIEYVIREDAAGNRQPTTFAQVTGILGRVKLIAHGEVTVNGRPAPSPKPTKTIAQLRMEAAESDKYLSTAMEAWQSPNRTWHRLSLIREELEAYLNTGYVKPSGKGKLPRAPDHGLCSEKDYLRFTRSVNHFDVAGIDSRHGHGKTDAPSDPMTLDEATQFIKRLFEKILDRRSAQLAASTPQDTPMTQSA